MEPKDQGLWGVCACSYPGCNEPVYAIIPRECVRRLKRLPPTDILDKGAFECSLVNHIEK